MEEIRKKLESLKKKLQKNEKEDKDFREQFQKVITELFPRLQNPMKYIKDFFVRKNQLVVETTNKSFANELFLKREQLSESLKSSRFKEIYIK